MAILDLLKKGSINCPHCNAAFEVGPDLEALSKTAGDLVDKVARFFDDSKFQNPIEVIAEEFDLDDDEAAAALAAALCDEDILDSILDFIEDDGDQVDDEDDEDGGDYES